MFTEGFGFNFFQAVRMLERLDSRRRPIGRTGPPGAEIVRFRAHLSLSFPPSSIFDIDRRAQTGAMPLMTVAFLGLTGPSGILPRHYTEMLLRLDREGKGPERHTLRDWFDLFNHRLISLFYRAWEKYRFWVAYERGEYELPEPDPFTRSLFSLVGLGEPSLQGRLRVACREIIDEQEVEKPLARIDDLVLLYYGGLLSHRPRNASGLEALLDNYFRLPVQVRQFQGQWLPLEPVNQSRLAGSGSANNQMGVNLVAGERVWDVQGKFRIRLGPLSYADFLEFLPDRTVVAQRKAFFLLVHLVRIYVGPELDFDVQLRLRAPEVPPCVLEEGTGLGPRLGWNTWLRSQPLIQDADDAVFEGEEVYWLESPLTAASR